MKNYIVWFLMFNQLALLAWIPIVHNRLCFLYVAGCNLPISFLVVFNNVSDGGCSVAFFPCNTIVYFWYLGRPGPVLIFPFHTAGNPSLLGASVRNSARGKGHEEGGSAYAKAGLSLRSPPGNSQASTPKTRVWLLYYFVLSPTPLTLWGAVPYHHLSLWKRVNLQL